MGNTGLIGVLASLGGLGVALYLLFSEPALELQETSLITITAPKGRLSERIEVTLDGRPVTELWITVFKLVNSGDTDLSEEDFDGPIKFHTKEGIIAAVIPGEADPLDLKFQISNPEDNTFYLDAPLLLKKKNQSHSQPYLLPS